MPAEPLRAKLALLCHGVRLAPEDLSRFPGYRHKRASLSEGLCLDLLFPGLPGPVGINVAVHEPFVASSPFFLNTRSGWIEKDGEPFVRFRLMEPPSWYALSTEDGTPFQEVFQVHARSILATSLTNFCEYRNRGGACAYCALGSGPDKPKTKSPKLLRSVLVELKKRGTAYSEVNINAGALQNGEAALSLYEKAVAAVRGVVNWPVYVQLCPPGIPDAARRLAEAGVDAVSYNLEIWDPDLRKALLPEKSRVSREGYLEALEDACAVLGRGQASSWLIAGLEPVSSTMEGIRAVAQTGAVPFVTVFRPLLGSRLQNEPPPDPDALVPVFEELCRVLAQTGLSPARSKAGCAGCGCCTPLVEAP
ncbi:MAG: hypothetical protein JRI97_04615 [Deltaproteobacteria bacterium]|nr:hypothetical protein [Deltaproteobacteria bacterium]